MAVCAGSGGAVVKSELRRKGKGQRLRIVKERLRLVPFVDR